MSAARLALVTGATGGLGRAIAERLAADGMDLVVVGRDGAVVAALASEVRGRWPGRQVHGEVCDLARDGDVEAMAARLSAARLQPDVLVNNAATQGPIGPFVEAHWPTWAATVMVDLLAPVRLAQLALPWMVERGWGRVINVSGGGATGPRPDFSAYAVAKTGLVRFTETVAHELTGTGVTMNAVAPGPMNTRMLDEVLQAGPDRASREHAGAVRRAREGGAPPVQAASLVAWLASSASVGVNGRLISAVWDPWERLGAHTDALAGSDIYTLRRIVPKDRGEGWGDR
jgi:3-oxoacyl-[acyl-carrier protein] reductase